jgi:hypothetical protein
MSSPDQNKANVKAFYDLAFNQRQPEEAVKQYVGSSYRQHNPMADDGPEPFIGTRGHIESDIREGGFCATLFKTARNLLILNGEMSEWSIEHAWKTKLASRTDALQRAATHTRSAT